MRFFSYNSQFMNMLGKVGDYLILGALWIVGSLGIFTMGAATTAMLYTAEKSIYRDEGDIFKTFWKSFAKEFKQATVLWLIALIPFLLFQINIQLFYQVEIPKVYVFLSMCASLVCFLWTALWFGYLSRFQASLKDLLQNTLRIALADFPKMLVLGLFLLVMILVATVAFWTAPLALFFLPSVYSACIGGIYRWIFGPYFPDEDNA